MGILLSIYLTAFISDGFFWPINEVHAGVTWSLLFCSYYLYIIENKPIKWFNYLVLILLSALAISSHLLASIPLFFLWIIINVNQYPSFSKLFKSKSFIVISVGMLVLLFFKYKMSKNGWYDQNKLSSLDNLSILSIINVFKSGESHSFLNGIKNNYFPILILLAIGVFDDIRRKKLFNIIVTAFSIAIFYSLVCIIFPNAYERNLQFYMESEWAGLAVILAAGFSILLAKTKHSYLNVLLILFFLARIFNGYNGYKLFNDRLQLLTAQTQYLQNNHVKKAIIIDQYATLSKAYLIDWGLPVESIMLCCLENKTPQVTFKLVDSSFKIYSPKDSFFSCFKVQSFRTLNKQYFTIDTISNYVVMPNVGNVLKN